MHYNSLREIDTVQIVRKMNAPALWELVTYMCDSACNNSALHTSAVKTTSENSAGIVLL